MLKVKIIMNSVMEEILSFKCCGLHNQNLEMHVDNSGDSPLTVLSRFRLEGKGKVLDCDHLFPPGGQLIQPGTGAAFYCALDETEYREYERLCIFDGEGNSYQFITKDITDYQVPGKLA